MAGDSPDGIYSIGAVARMLGVERATIRNWEERYGVVQPQRSSGRQRLFSRDDVERLRFVAIHVANGASPADAHRLLAEHLMTGRPLIADEDEQRPQLLVLLAERDRLAADLSEFFLRTEGYEVRCAFDTDDALRSYDEHRPALVVVDLLMSEGAGFRLCQDLKDRGLPSLLALSTLATRDRAMAFGADAFLQKPVDPLRLVSTVKDLLGESALARRPEQVTSG